MIYRIWNLTPPEIQNSIFQISSGLFFTPPRQQICQLIANELLELSIANNKDIQCPICLDNVTENLEITFCGHKFHSRCLQQAINARVRFQILYIIFY